MASVIPDAILLETFHSEPLKFNGVATGSNGAPLNLTLPGTTLVHEEATGPGQAPLVAAAIGSGITVDASGNYAVDIDESVTSALGQNARYDWNLTLTQPGGDPEIIAHGKHWVHGSIR